VFSGVFRVEEDDELGDKMSGDSTMVDIGDNTMVDIGDSTMVDIQTLLEAFLNMPLISASFTEVLSGKKQNFCLG